MTDKVAVTGATGFIGSHLLRRLERTEWVPVPIVRKPTQLRNEIVIGSLQSPKGMKISPVTAFIHLAARTHVTKETHPNPIDAYIEVNVKGTRVALELAQKAGADHFIYLSSAKAMGEETLPGYPFSDESIPAPEDPYGRTKLMAEREVERFCSENGMAWSIVRPPLVYGQGVKANFASLAKLAASGVPLPLAKANNARSLVFVENLVDFIVFCLNTTETRGRTFLVDDGQPLSIAELVAKIAAVNDRKARLMPVPNSLLKFIASAIGKGAIYRKVFGNLEIDSKAAREAGWSPPFSSDYGLKATFHGWLEN